MNQFFSKSIALLTIGMGIVSCGTREADSGPPNFFIIFIDNLGYNDLVRVLTKRLY